MEPLRPGGSAGFGWFPGAVGEAISAKTEIVGLSKQLSLVMLLGVQFTGRNGSGGQQLSDHLQVQAFLMVAKLTTLPSLGMEVGFHPAHKSLSGTTQPTQLFKTSILVRVDNATHKLVSCSP